MPLTTQQIARFKQAIADYAFPAAYFDFHAGVPVPGLTMAQVEKRILADLITGDPVWVRNGLASILYWGYAQMGGLAAIRVGRFHARVTAVELGAAAALFSRTRQPSLLEIARLGLPQFSGVSFVSKVRMFLDPVSSATLDNQIMKIHARRQDTVLAGVRKWTGTSIPVTAANSQAYEAWCRRLNDIRVAYSLAKRVVDVERGLFHMVQSGRVHLAADLMACA